MWEGDLVSLYYVRNRWYDPELGRFMSEDPIGHAGGENLYTFANNDPVNAADPSGMSRDGCVTKWIEFGSASGLETHAYSFEFCRGVGGGGIDNGTPRGFAPPSDLGGNGGGGGGGTLKSIANALSKTRTFTPTKTCKEDLFQFGLAFAGDFAGVGVLEGAKAFREVAFAGSRLPTAAVSSTFALNAALLPSQLALLHSGGTTFQPRSEVLGVLYHIGKELPWFGSGIELIEAATSCINW